MLAIIVDIIKIIKPAKTKSFKGKLLVLIINLLYSKLSKNHLYKLDKEILIFSNFIRMTDKSKVYKRIKRKCYFSECKSYRWVLDLKISLRKKEIIFIGLNPSLTDQKLLDNTTKKIIKICNYNKYGNIKLINLFGLISKSPKLLKTHKDPIGFQNNSVIEFYLNYWSKTIYCDLWIGWGNKGTLFNRDLQVYKVLKKYISIKKDNFPKFSRPYLIKKTKSNNPIHPLYCSDNSKFDYF